MNPAEIRRKIEEARSELRAIHETAKNDKDRTLTRAEERRFNELTTEIEDREADLRDAEAAEARMSRVSASRSTFGTLSVGDSPAASYDPREVARMGAREVRDQARRLLDSARHLEAHQGDHMDMLLNQQTRNVSGDYLARRTLLTETPAYRSAFMRLMSSPQPMLSAEEAEAVRAVQELEQRAMSEGTPAAGGYGVPVLIDPTIILTAQQSANPFMSISTVKSITTDRWKGVSSTGVTWSWDDEAEEVSDDTPTLDQPEIPVYAARGFVPFSIEVGTDYPSFATEVGGLLAEGYDEITAAAFATGSGSGQPTGIVTALDANTNVEVLPTTDGAFGAADISKLWVALPDRAKRNATWLMGEGTKEEIRKFATDQQSTQTVDLKGAEFQIRERPVRTSSSMTDFTGVTTKQNLIVVGDFRKYYVIQRAGMNLELVPHLFGTTNNRPTGERGFFAHARVGADSVDDLAFRLLQNQ